LLHYWRRLTPVGTEVISTSDSPYGLFQYGYQLQGVFLSTYEPLTTHYWVLPYFIEFSWFSGNPLGQTLGG
jgi:hypothetical protein